MYILSNELYFPDATQADDEGIIAIGGDLSTERLLLAYRSGIFPWYNEDEPIIWWNPNPRCVLFPKDLYISKSMQTVLKKNSFDFKMNNSFKEVMQNCKTVLRNGEAGSWINNEMIEAYCNLHKKGFAICGEAWQNNKLVGGLYGVKIGNVFFGESMFSKVTNASKFAFTKLVQHLQTQNIQLIDCQVHTSHLESLGATLMDREHFIEMVKILT